MLYSGSCLALLGIASLGDRFESESDEVGVDRSWIVLAVVRFVFGWVGCSGHQGISQFCSQGSRGSRIGLCRGR